MANTDVDGVAAPFHGEVPGVEIGDVFENRQALMPSGLHGITTAGIWTKKEESPAAASIVLNGGYPDDQDFGDRILYTGMGGQKNRRQTADQSFDQYANRALLENLERAIPVRVIRGYKGDPQHSPAKGFRYDGLYYVTRAWRGPGGADDTRAFQMCMFQLERARPDTDPRASSAEKHRVDSAARLAVERHAVEVTSRYFESLGYEIEDVGVPGHPYDLIARDASEQLRIEVKGRRSAASTVDVTANEVSAARNYDRSVLAVVDEITLSYEPELRASEGRLRIWLGWNPVGEDLEPTQYRLSLPETAHLP